LDFSKKYSLNSYKSGLAGNCRISTSGQNVSITGYTNLPRTEIELQKALANVGPISVAIFVSSNFVAYQKGKNQFENFTLGLNFKLKSLFYQGIFYDDICNNLTPDYVNHAVTGWFYILKFCNLF